MKIHNVQQGTPEWQEIRRGKLTASNAQQIGNNGKGLDTYILQVVANKYSLPEEQYTSKDMERGNELEDQARAMFSLENGVQIKQVGFVEMNEYVGCSPDGYTEDYGIEIKCHNNAKHFNLLLNGEKAIDSGYIWQMQMCIMVTGIPEWKFISYNPNFEKSLIVFPIKPDKKKLEKLELGIEEGIKKIKMFEDQYKKLL